MSQTRRHWLLSATAAAGGMAAGTAHALPPANEPVAAERLRDRFWMFGVPAGVNNQGWGLPRPSMITPLEACYYLGVPNMFMITVDGNPPLPYDQYARPMRALKKLAWCLVGSGGTTAREDREHVLKLAADFPNMVGFFMDDFFKKDGSGALTPDELKQLSVERVIAGRKRDLYVVLYDHQLGLPVESHLAHCDKITFWTWKAHDLQNLERNFARLEALAPRHGKLLGMYMWDYGNKREMPVHLMQRQCELGLKWLKEGRLEGLIFLGSAVCDIELPAVEWSRAWIAAVGDQPLR